MTFLRYSFSKEFLLEYLMKRLIIRHTIVLKSLQYFRITIALLIIFVNPLYCIEFQELKDYMFKNSKQLQIKKYDIDISNKDLSIIDSDAYPTISIGYNIEKSESLNSKISNTSIGDNSLSNDTLKKSYSYLSLDYNLYSFGRLEKKRQNQKYLINVSKFEYCLECQDLSLKLLEQYNNILNNQIKADYLAKIIEEKNKIYKYKEKLFESGDISSLDVTNSAIDVADMYSQISDNQKEFKNLYNQIVLITNYPLLGKEHFNPLIISNITSQKEFEKSVNAKIIESKIKAKEFEIALYENDYLPNLNFYSKYDFYGYDKDSYKQSIDGMKENSYKFGLNLSINIFNGFKTSSQKEKALFQLKQLQTQYDFDKDKFDNEILTLNQNYNFDTFNLENKSKTLDLAFLIERNSSKLKEIGELNQIEILNSNIEKLYKELDYKLNEGQLSYEYAKKSILLEDDKCIAHW